MQGVRLSIWSVLALSWLTGAAGAQWSTFGTKIYYNGGNVGIGTYNPAYALDVRGSSQRAISGLNSAATGFTYGVYGSIASAQGAGVAGISTELNGTGWGVYGAANGAYGRGVVGYASSESTALTIGVWGRARSTAGVGVYGNSQATDGFTYGGYFQADSTDGIGCSGYVPALTGETYGGYFTANSTDGVGVFGDATSRTGFTYGGYFRSDSTQGRAVFAYAASPNGPSRAIYAVCNSPTGYAGYFGGHVYATGSITQASRRSLKDDIRPLSGALDAVLAMNPVSYRWNAKAGPSLEGVRDIGFIADEMFEVVPDLVELDNAGEPESIAYAKLTAVLAGAVKEQQQLLTQLGESNARLEEDNKALHAENAELRARLDRLEAAVRAMQQE
ncbi:MAG: hypothetical protein Kow0022_13740 [Phycisphaerales bacterium]